MVIYNNFICPVMQVAVAVATMRILLFYKLRVG